MTVTPDHIRKAIKQDWRFQDKDIFQVYAPYAARLNRIFKDRLDEAVTFESLARYRAEVTEYIFNRPEWRKLPGYLDTLAQFQTELKAPSQRDRQLWARSSPPDRLWVLRMTFHMPEDMAKELLAGTLTVGAILERRPSVLLFTPIIPTVHIGSDIWR